MRIRKSAARTFGSANSIPAAPAPDASSNPLEQLKPPPPPMPLLAPCTAPESCVGGGLASPPTPTASVERCELSRSPWDLIADLSLDDSQEDELVEKYFVSVSVPAPSLKKETLTVGASTVRRNSTTRPRRAVVMKAPKKMAATASKDKAKEMIDPKNKSKVKIEEDQETKPTTYQCKKNDGKRWHCKQPANRPNSLCDYHLNRRRACLKPDFASIMSAKLEAPVEMKVSRPAAISKSKPAASSVPRRKQKPGHDVAATEGFYYYAGFGPETRSKKQRRSRGMNEPVPPQLQEEKDELAEDCSPLTNQQAPAVDDGPYKAAARGDGSIWDHVTGIAGCDEESSDDDYRPGVSVCNMNGNGEHRNGKRKNGWKRGRKPVKARSLKSLM